MNGIVIRDVGDVELTTVPKPEPGPSEALVRVRRVGFCRTDKELLEGKHPDSEQFARGESVIPGHEWVGEVADASRCDTVVEGQRVTGETTIYCEDCSFCAAGQTNLCTDAEEIGISRDGAMAEYLAVPEHVLHPIPEAVPDHIAVLTEPTAVAVHAVDRALSVSDADDVLVFGDGPIGLLTAEVAKHVFADRVAVVGHSETKLAIADQIGCDLTINTAGADDPVAVIDEALADAGIDPKLTFEAVGKSAVVDQTVQTVSPSGTVVFLGLEKESLIDMQSVVFGELNLLGSVSSPGVWPRTIDMLEELTLEPLLTAEISLSAAPEHLQEKDVSPVEQVKTVVAFD